ncbi:S8 family serine peptidase [Alteribacillus sp. HJP-4]|uniref:S8 family serine peptidase n=1 Tax=Alteribacillus sp. HJP-4 TaxID=2775394 RepID=UPI0035CCF58E
MEKDLRNAKRTIAGALLSFVVFSAGAGGIEAAPSQPEQKSSVEDEMAVLKGEHDLNSKERTRVIVEIDEPSLVEARQTGQPSSREQIKNSRDQVSADVLERLEDGEVDREYDYVFSGFSLELEGEDILSILSVDGVKAVYPNAQYETDQIGETTELDAEEFHPLMADSAPYIGADEAWEAGYTGEGITVAVIDTGVDYTHPDLEHAFGSYKGYDFVDEDSDPQETQPGENPGDETNHGSHVAGTIAANGNIKGIAPDADLLGYRVLGPGGSGTTEDVLAGIEQAVEDGADIMNLSLGNTLNDPDYATSTALDWAMEEGVVAVTSNGNAGDSEWTVGSPGTSRDAISVGASQLPYNEFDTELDLGSVSFPDAEILGFPSEDELLELEGETREVVFAGLGSEEEFQEIDAEGKIALMERGELAFVDKAINAEAAGADGAIIYNNVSGPIPFYIPGMAVPTWKLDDISGRDLAEAVEDGDNEVTISLAEAGKVGETIADFSSRGPVMDTWMIKPDVSAPGVDITSTVPTYNEEEPHGYASMQGTSMASPHVAGAAAVLLEKHSDWEVEEVKGALMNTAERLNDPEGNDYPHNAQGAGSIRLPEALDTETIAVPGSHSFGTFLKDNGRQVERQHFSIQNESGERKDYDLDVTFDGNPDGISVSTSKNTKINPGQTKKVNMNVKVTASKLDPGYHEGMITLTDDEEEIEIPTILFVQEPDYPRVSDFQIDLMEDGTFLMDVYTPGGAETAEIVLYESDLLEFQGVVASRQNLDPGYHSFTWDGLLEGEPLAPGEYHLFAFAEKSGQVDNMYGGSFTVSE